ncbi:hypothetical protein I7X12_05600 [Halosimplex litoreum]|uniref:Uncharacterized protein n=1 Tax=Halosimplex litoreum TaxID=1198301 RepID=A0A7T3G0G1_9EURY|nr:hypothetical protein [Halosimplex litoreum]QPV64100.1 hypothetical protein I7X12_05600 [Halosimplex litoreum]
MLRASIEDTGEDGALVQLVDHADETHHVLVSWDGTIERHLQERFPPQGECDDATVEHVQRLHRRALYEVHWETDAEFVPTQKDPEYLRDAIDCLKDRSEDAFAEHFRPFYDAVQDPPIDCPPSAIESIVYRVRFSPGVSAVTETSAPLVVYQSEDGPVMESRGDRLEDYDVKIQLLPETLDIPCDDQFRRRVCRQLSCQMRDLYYKMAQRPPLAYRVSGIGLADAVSLDQQPLVADRLETGDTSPPRAEGGPSPTAPASANRSAASAGDAVDVPDDAPEFRIIRIHPEEQVMLWFNEDEGPRWVRYDDFAPSQAKNMSDFVRGNVVRADFSDDGTCERTITPPDPEECWAFDAVERVDDAVLAFFDAVDWVPEIADGAYDAAGEDSWGIASTFITDVDDDEASFEAHASPTSADKGTIYEAILRVDLTMENLFDELSTTDMPARHLIVARPTHRPYVVVLALTEASELDGYFHQKFRDASVV